MHTSRRRAAAILSTGVAGLLLLSGAGSSTALNTGQATKVVIQFYKSNLKANDNLSSNLLNKLEEGVSATMDDRGYTLLAKAGETTESAPPIPSKSEISLALSPSQPTSFLALIKFPARTGTTPTAATTEYLVFRKDRKSIPWRVLYEPAVETSLTLPRLSAKSPAIKSGASTSEFVDLAKYYNGVTERFASGPLTSQWLAAGQQDIATALSNGINFSVTYKVAASPITTVAVNKGALEFGTLSEANQSIPTPSGTCMETSSGDSNEVLALAPSGTPYSSVAASYLLQAVIFVPQNRRQLPQVLGADQQLMSVSAPAC
ncbi:MAG TPA: hypothetical protein VNH82_04985 [Candidatus Dormibacteraeota bacterium]|nr:hypothetical protein [Candidatus Dormibacteraeota bacterium]